MLVSTLDAVGELLAALDAHALHEDTFIAPVLRARAAERAVAWDAEHRHLDRAEGSLRGQVARLRELGTSHGAARADGLALYRAFNRFTAATLRHLDTEETELMPMLWATCSDAELVSIMTSFKARYGAEAASFYRHAALAYAPNERELLGV